MKYFISYTADDRAWAEWIAWVLEEAGHNATVQAWDFRPGNNFVLGMQEAAEKADRTIVVLSPAFIESPFAAAEWAAEFADDPQGVRRRLIPIRVEACKPPGLLSAIVYIDLVGRGRDDARQVLLDGVEKDRAKPASEPPFPAQSALVATEPEAPLRPSPATIDDELVWLARPPTAADSSLEQILHLRSPISPDAIVERWRSTESSRLKVLLGKDAFGRPLELDLLGDGPLGHIIGNSGSGTTTALHSIALYLALSFPPSRIRLHLCSSEGKRVWDGFASLPHVTLRSVDDGPGGAVEGIMQLTADKMRALGATQTSEIGMHNQAFPEDALPIDLVLIDDVDQPAPWVDGFSRLLRIGRSLGITAIPAFQSQARVTPRFLMDSRFAVVLGTPHVSSDYLDRYSARGLNGLLQALTPPLAPGRGFLLRSETGWVPYQTARISETHFPYRDSSSPAVSRLDEIVRAIRMAHDSIGPSGLLGRD